MEIRDFAPKDRGAFVEMCVAFYSSGAANCSLSQEAMNRTFEATIAKSPFLRGLILEEAGEVVGYGHVSFTYANEADGLVMFIEEIYIKPEHQGKGLGTQFLHWLFAEYQGRVKWYELEVDEENKGALTLYQRLGFERNDYLHLKLVGADLQI